MEKIKLKDKEFTLSIPEAKIQEAVKQIADNINEDLKNEKTPLFLGILNGAFMFLSDLFKEINIDCEVSFVKLASYQGTNSTGDVKQLIGLNENLSGRNVIIVEDIVDTGLTINNLVKQVKGYDPEKVRVASLLFKPDACQEFINLDYVGIEIPNEFIVGYGLDYDGLGRNYKDIYKAIS
ncbi:MAG: hypoxanthine phosphoribosyltransferase [Bacteroidales bacterium]